MHMHHHHRHRGGSGIAISGSTGSMVGIVVMFFVGLLMFGMCALFIGIALSVDILHDSFLMTGGFLALVGVLMFGIGIAMWVKRANAKRVQATGVPGQAMVMGVTQTSMYVNGAPVVELQLQVTTATAAPYVVTRRETVPPTMMGRLMSGQPLPVMVDPARPDNLVISWV